MLVRVHQEVTGLLELSVTSGIKSTVMRLADHDVYTFQRYSALAPYLYYNTNNKNSNLSLISGVLYRLDQVYSDTSVQSDLVSVELNDEVIKTKRVTSRVDSDVVNQLQKSRTSRIDINIYSFELKRRPVVAIFNLSTNRFLIHIAPTAESLIIRRLCALEVPYKNVSLLDGAFLSMVTGRIIPLRKRY